MATLHVLRVFVGEDGRGGNPLGVFLDGGAVAEADRQGVAARLGYSETVFVENAGRGELRIFTPGVELPFAGHPLVGTAWLLAREREPVDVLRPPAGEVAVRHEGEMIWIAGRPEWSPPMEFIRHPSPAEVDALDPGEDDAAYHWAWEDETTGRIRARAFFREYGIDEDEATGAAALALSASLGREISIRQGRGSRLLAWPLEDGLAEVGGRAELVEVREDPGR
jgi:predicted PhzF superfamily epimerase YddE/YHI9